MGKGAGDDRGGGEKRAAWAQYLSLSTLGIEMGASLVVGIGIGWFLDRHFKTAPWLLVIFTCFGIASGFRSIVRVAREQARANRGGGDRSKEGNDGEQ